MQLESCKVAQEMLG